MLSTFVGEGVIQVGPIIGISIWASKRILDGSSCNIDACISLKSFRIVSITVAICVITLSWVVDEGIISLLI